MSAAITTAHNATSVAGLDGWSTPKKLRIFLAISWALVALLFAVGEANLDSARHAVKTIGKDAAPSIIAAQEIGLSLAEIDANVANILLGNPAHRAAASEVVEKHRLLLTKSLVDAAQNITYGDAEKIPIQALVTDLGKYLELATEARVLFERSKDIGPHAEKDARGALVAYWNATDLLHARLLVSADALDAANRKYLDSAYAAQKSSDGSAIFLVLVLGFALLAMLGYAQLFLFRRMRRFINPGLLLATLVAIGYTGYLVTRFQEASSSLKLAKEDAFDSIHSLVKARSLAYDANGDESRWLLDQSAQRGLEEAFHRKVRVLTTAPEVDPPTQKSAVSFSGLFADEFKNITFDGEQEAAADMARAFARYHAIDVEIRRLFRLGHVAAAIELCIGDRPDQSNAAFERFDSALVKVIAINRTHFDRVIDSETTALKSAEIIAPFCALAIAALAFFGIRSRLREYAA